MKRTHFLFKGAKIAFSEKGTGRNVLFIHGFLGAKELWNSYQKRLAKNYRVITLDLLGHGGSESIGYVHSMELIADSIAALFKHLNIRKSFIIGHSLGGYASLAFAEQFPDRVNGLIMINSSAQGDNQQRLESRNQLIELVKQDKEKALRLLVPSFFNLKKRNTHWQVKKYLKLALQCSEKSIIASIEGMKIRKEREIVLKFAPFPYRYIIGKQDAILNEEKLIQESKLSRKGGAILLEDASHMSFLEVEEQVFRVINRFLKKN